MVLNPGIPKKKRHFLRWIIVICVIFMLFLLGMTAILIKYYHLRQITIVEKPLITINETAVYVVSSIMSSIATSEISSALSSKESYISSSGFSSSFNSFIQYLTNLSNQAQQSLISTTTETPTTTLSFDYTSYSVKVPMKFKYCNPLERKVYNETSNTYIVIPADKCITINASCCPCSTKGIIDGVLKTISWGGSVDSINEKNYPVYLSTYLKNCTGFGVKCRMASTGAGCNYESACVGGLCKLVTRY
jgi:hypothetical protein